MEVKAPRMVRIRVRARAREEQETWNSSRAENMTEAINRGVLREHTTDG